jgi:UDP-N-acetylglucosamine 2-epimerase (non-hydrolysing)
MGEWFRQVNELAKEYPQIKFVLPIHPNPNVQKHRHLLTDVKVINPLEHEDMIKLIKDSKLIISDSGGLQEEGSFLNKKVIVCRETTERPEGIETGHLHMCKTPNDLFPLFDKLIKNYYIDSPCPYGDGMASERIKNIIG